jgi:hypothetical protein
LFILRRPRCAQERVGAPGLPLPSPWSRRKHTRRDLSSLLLAARERPQNHRASRFQRRISWQSSRVQPQPPSGAQMSTTSRRGRRSQPPAMLTYTGPANFLSFYPQSFLAPAAPVTLCRLAQTCATLLSSRRGYVPIKVLRQNKCLRSALIKGDGLIAEKDRSTPLRL